MTEKANLCAVVLAVLALDLSALPPQREGAGAPPRPAEGAAFVSQSVPSTMPAEELVPVTIEMKNSGTVAWDSSFALCPITTVWKTKKTHLGEGERVEPGAAKTFSFSVTAPAAPGTYPFRCQMLSRHGRIGEPSPQVMVTVEPSARGNDAKFVSQSIPNRMAPGAPNPVSITMKNTGTTIWTAQGGYELEFDGPAGSQHGSADRIALDPSDSIAPGQSKTFLSTVEGAQLRSRVRWRMAQKGKQRFGEPSKLVGIGLVSFGGSLDVVNCRTIDGWAADRKDYRQHQKVAIFADGKRFAVVTADKLRPDLAAARIGKGDHSYSLATPGFLLDGKPHSIRAIMVSADDFELPASPKSVTCAAPKKRRHK